MALTYKTEIYPYYPMNSKTFLFVTGISAGIAAFYLQNNEQLVQSFIFGGNFGLLLMIKRFEVAAEKAQ